MEKALKNYKILFLIGVASSFILYQMRLSGKADIALLITSLMTGYSMMNWIELKQKEDDVIIKAFNDRIDEMENRLQVQADTLNYAVEIGRKMMRLEAKIEMLKEKIKELS